MASEIKVDTIVNAGGDNDSGIDLATNDIVKVKTANSERARIDANGNMLLGKTSLDNSTVGARINATGDASFVRSGAKAMFLNRTTDDGDVCLFAKDNSTIGGISVYGGSLNIGGGDVGLGFYQVADGVVPINNGTGALRDDAIDIGNASGRFDDIHATNSSIQTSDQNEKQDIASITYKELNVAKKLSALFKTFRWKSKVAEKGDKARTHTGIIAQEIQSAFSAEGLDVSKYGLFTSSTWWEKDERVYFTKEEAPEDATERTRLGVRYPELFSFIFSSIEARLTALESK